MKLKPSNIQILFYIILASGILLSLFQFLYNRSLWLDESSIALNIIDRSFYELLQPLDYAQVAPVLFLIIEKLFSLIIPNSEIGLRLFPFIAHLASVFLFYKIIIILIQDRRAQLLALTLFLFNPTIIYFSSEVKQYMVDVFVANLLFYLTIKDCVNILHKFSILFFAGAVCLFLSHITIIILFVIGCLIVYLYYYKSEKSNLKYLLILFSGWGITAFLFYIFFVKGHPTQNGMIHYWISINAFLPKNPFCYDFYSFLIHKLYTISLNITLIPRLSYFNAIFIYFLYGLGLFYLARNRNFVLFIILVLPLIIHLIFSALQFYPFDTRLILYLYPSFIIMLSFGFLMLRELFFRFYKKAFTIFFLILITSVFYNAISKVPIKFEEMKPVIKYIEKNICNDDQVYISNIAFKSFNYYQKTGFVNFKNPVHRGVECLENRDNFLNEILLIKGNCWLIFSHVKEEEIFITSKLDSLKCPQKDKLIEFGVSTYLYTIR